MRCNERCVICHKRLEYESSRLRPCEEYFCQFRFEETFGCSIYTELKDNIKSIELDLAFANNAIISHRAKDVVEPFPTFLLLHQEIREKSGFFDDMKKYGKSHTDTSNKNLEAMRSVFQNLPKLSNLYQSSSSEVFIYIGKP